MEMPDEEMNISQVSRLVGIWVNGVEAAGEGGVDDENMRIMQEAWDDGNGGNCLWEKAKRQGVRRLGIWSTGKYGARCQQGCVGG